MDESKFVGWMAAVIIVTLLFVYAASAKYYHHPMPAGDCSQAYDYPICKRAREPVPLPLPNIPGMLGGIALAVALSIGLTWVSFQSTIMRKAPEPSGVRK